MRNNIIKYDMALQFMYGGNAEFIIENIVSKNRFFYKITKSEGNDDLFFVKVKKPSEDITDNHNRESIIYAGYIVRNRNGYIFKQGKKGKVANLDITIKALMYTTDCLFNKKINKCIVIKHVGKCGVCGKRLTDDESIKRGFGIYCYKKYILQEKR